MEQVIHGVFLVIHDLGVLLLGPPGAGKSTLALELVARGHALVADDAPLFRRAGERLVGRAAPATAGFIHVRGLGPFDVRRQYGAAAVRDSHPLDLVIAPADSAGAGAEVPLRRETCLAVTVAVLRPPADALRAAVVEAMVARHRLVLAGHDPGMALARRQHEAMDGGS